MHRNFGQAVEIFFKFRVDSNDFLENAVVEVMQTIITPGAVR